MSTSILLVSQNILLVCPGTLGSNTATMQVIRTQSLLKNWLSANTGNTMRANKQHNDHFLSRLGDALRSRRLEIDLTQQELASKTNLHRTYITDVEAGHRNISMLTYNTLTDALLCRPSLPMLKAERSMELSAITPFGINGELSKASKQLRLSNQFCLQLTIVTLELQVKAAMSMLQGAVETFAQRLHSYPSNKKELQDCLSGQTPVNPFTKRRRFPSLGSAADEKLATRAPCLLEPGELEYSPIRDGINYIIRGGGADGKGLAGSSVGSTYVLSGNLRTDNQP